MSIYLVALTKPDEKVWERIEQKWSDSHSIASETVAFILSNGESTPFTVRTQLGISTDDQDPSGIVVAIHPYDYSGVVPMDTVNWLRDAESKRY